MRFFEQLLTFLGLSNSGHSRHPPAQHNLHCSLKMHPRKETLASVSHQSWKPQISKNYKKTRYVLATSVAKGTSCFFSSLHAFFRGKVLVENHFYTSGSRVCKAICIPAATGCARRRVPSRSKREAGGQRGGRGAAQGGYPMNKSLGEGFRLKNIF